ncbi:MAG TPA: hypothetical protein VNO53_08675 [Steroidobacteraceae bacterium]|nr:hypothetical protein [Steroidobacteraceae bacterium]
MKFFRIKTTVRVHPDYLEVGCTGLYSRAEALRVGDEAYREAARSNRSAVLVDVREITGRVPTILDRFEMGMRIAKHYLESDPRTRLAVLGHEPMIHPERFGELVARNRGADARVFTDEAEALGWLLERGNGR